ncbi:arginase family protein [Sulfitobacter sp.]|uniref:arginase family protein n=1 Tax=Sulfitobacter sp. TaxID=1903071 RepID=UPI0030017290
MNDAEQTQFYQIPSFLGATVGDLEDLVSGQVALAGYFCDNLERPSAGQRYLARQLRYASGPENTPGNAIDLGDVNVFPLETEKHFSAVEAQCRSVLKKGARMVLVGGDSSGLKALGIAAQHVIGTGVRVVSLAASAQDDLSKTTPIVLSVDLQGLAGIWLSQPRRLGGLSPAQMVAQIDAVEGNAIAAAVFGLAPALDGHGKTETQAALAILQAVKNRLEKGVH